MSSVWTMFTEVFSSSSSAKSAQAIFGFSNWLSRLHVDMSCVCAYWGLTCWHSLHLIRWDELTDDVEEGICLVGALLNVLKGARTEALLSSACISVSGTNEVRDSDILKGCLQNKKKTEIKDIVPFSPDTLPP